MSKENKRSWPPPGPTSKRWKSWPTAAKRGYADPKVLTQPRGDELLVSRERPPDSESPTEARKEGQAAGDVGLCGPQARPESTV